jgi:hypothetical protein
MTTWEEISNSWDLSDSELEEIENSWEFCWKCDEQLQPFKCPNGCPEEDPND